MITTRFVRLALSALMLAATADLVATPTATAQALPTYTCKYTYLEFGYVKGRECTASPGAPSSGDHWVTSVMESRATGERWVCTNIEADIIPHYVDDTDFERSDFERIHGHGVDGYSCDRILD